MKTAELNTKSKILDIEAIRKDFPVLNQFVNGKPLVYLDNAASSHIPVKVMDTFVDYHSRFHSNVHRGVHSLSQHATDAFEGVREKVRDFINAGSSNEIIFTSGTTDSINLVANTWGKDNIKKGDEILISNMEHHSNIVPWFMLAKELGAVIKVIPIDDAGNLILEDYYRLLSPKTKVVAINHVSNALGTINPILKITELAHSVGAIVVVDGAQAVPHMKVDVTSLGVDYYAFSAHKMYGPTGIGVLYGKSSHLIKSRPYRGGGDMILSVSFKEIKFNDIPHKFEAGTPAIAQAIMLGASIEYLNSIGIDQIANYENDLLKYATQQISEILEVKLIGTAKEKASVLSFIVDGIHPHDLGTILDEEGIAVRTGHHCAQPVMERYNIPATTRASFAFYNTFDEADKLQIAVRKAIEIFK